MFLLGRRGEGPGDQPELPSPSELDPLPRVLYESATAADLALRTGLASAITALMIPATLGLDGRAERRHLEFYAELTTQRDPERVFVAPPWEVKVRTERGRGPRGGGGHVELLRFQSPYAPINPDARHDYLAHERNAIARAQHWRHDGAPRPALVVIHGFGASPAWFNALFFSLEEFFAEGWDIVLFTMPFHGGRRGPRAPFNGAELFTGGFSRLNEAILQAVCDLRVLLAHLRRRGAERIGLTGLSLGGYTTALMAAVEPSLAFAIPNAALASMPEIMRAWFPTNLGSRALGAIKGIPAELITRALELHSPLTYPPRLSRERLMVVAGLGDRLAPPVHSVMLWEHWARPELRWFPGSHILHFQRGAYLDAMRGLMAGAEPREPQAPTTA
jgi:pimeloyl-ACP methyl ester carboxylesterase